MIKLMAVNQISSSEGAAVCSLGLQPQVHSSTR